MSEGGGWFVMRGVVRGKDCVEACLWCAERKVV